MPRPKGVRRQGDMTRIHISIPNQLEARLQLQFCNEHTGTKTYGAISHLITRLLIRYFREQEAVLKAKEQVDAQRLSGPSSRPNSSNEPHQLTPLKITKGGVVSGGR